MVTNWTPFIVTVFETKDFFYKDDQMYLSISEETASQRECRKKWEVVVVRWQQGKNGKEAREETEGKSSRVHRGR